MATKVEKHKRKKKNGVSVVRQHTRKDKKKSKKGYGSEMEKKKSSCSSC